MSCVISLIWKVEKEVYLDRASVQASIPSEWGMLLYMSTTSMVRRRCSLLEGFNSWLRVSMSWRRCIVSLHQ